MLFRSSTFGLLCCMISASAYSGANIAMKQLSDLGTNDCWATAGRETMTVLIVGPYLLWQTVRNRDYWPSWKIISLLIVMGLGTQLIGNLGYQFSLGVIGLSLTIPIIFASMLVTTALTSVIFLREKISLRAFCAICLLGLAIGVLQFGTGEPATDESLATSKTSLASLAFLASCLAGAIYGAMNVTIRHAMTQGTHKPGVLVIITGIATVTLFPYLMVQNGTAVIAQTSGEQWLLILASGLCNLVGFYFLNKGLELTTAVHVNVTTSSQVAIAAIAGLFIFGEQMTIYLAIGTALTVLGVILIGEDKS